MKPAAFTFHRATSVDEAVALLAEHAPDGGRIIAGGQSLVPMMAFRLARPPHLIDINRIEALARLEEDGGELVIGAGVRHAAFHRPAIAGPLGRILGTVVGHIAHYPIRTRGTFCGSLAHADPASEWCLTAVTLGGRVVARSLGGERTIAIEDYLQGAMMTALAEDELLTAVRLTVPPPDSRFGFNEFCRRPGDYAPAMALAGGRFDDGRIVEPRVGLGGVEETPRRMAAAEAILAGAAPGEAVLRAAADAAAEACDPMDDGRMRLEYRRGLVRTVVYRALQEAFA